MKKRKLHTNLLLLFVLFFTMGNNPVSAQANSALEFAKIAGDGNPTGNGPVNATTINFVKNTNNPTGNRSEESRVGKECRSRRTRYNTSKIHIENYMKDV